MNESPYFTLAEASQRQRVSKDVLKAAIDSGSLRAKKSGANGGGIYLIRAEALDAWFDTLADA